MRNNPKATIVGIGVALLVVLAPIVALVSPLPEETEAGTTGAAVTALGTDGSPIEDASVRVLRGATASADEPVLLEASAPGHARRVIAAAPGEEVSVVLAEESAATVSMRFGGDVMFGRRFYESAGDAGPVIEDPASVSDHAAILDPIADMLADSDLAVVNLETPLLDPAVLAGAGTGADPALHGSKEFAFASSTATAPALADAGVDVVALGNNHVYDASEEGLESTVRALDEAGIGYFGAGRTIDEAWRPWVSTTASGEKVAFLGCTTVTGRQYAVSYVAEEGKGGAAECSPERMDAEVRAAATIADTVVVMIHGGVEYQSVQAPEVQRLTTIAARAGATAVVNSHPHVVGTLRMEGPALVAETMGNLVFDQDQWAPLASYLLRLDAKGGTVVHASADPVAITGYVPRPAVGALARSILRIAAGPASVQAGAGGPIHLLGSRPAPGAGVRAGSGRDLLLGTGDMEDATTAVNWADGGLWVLGKHVSRDPAARCTATGHGITLERGPLSTEDAIATTRHRIPVVAGTTLELGVDVRGAQEGGTAEIRWYDDLAGGSSGIDSVPVPRHSGDENECARVTLEVAVPPGAVAAQPYIRLAPPDSRVEGTFLSVDDVQLIERTAG